MIRNFPNWNLYVGHLCELSAQMAGAEGRAGNCRQQLPGGTPLEKASKISTGKRRILR
jgi:hypothetical protein